MVVTSPGTRSWGGGRTASRTACAPKGVTHPGLRHRSVVRRDGAACRGSRRTWVMELVRPVESVPAGAVWTRTVPEEEGT